MSWGVRRRTTLAATLAVAAVLALAAGIFLVALHRLLIGSVDAGAATEADNIVALLDQPSLSRLAPAGDDGSLVQVVNSAGRVVLASRSLTGEAPISTVRPGVDPITETLPDVSVDGVTRARLYARRVVGRHGDFTIYVLSSLAPVDGALRLAGFLLLVGLPIVLAGVALTTWLATGRALRPVERIRARVAAIGAHDLGERLPVPDSADEVSRLAATMNDMLARLQASVARQRRFVSDASHELRSPLASSRTQLEVALHHPERTDWAATAAGVLSEQVRMQELAEDLLLLARLDEAAPSRREEVDLDDLLAAEVRRLRLRAPHLQVDLVVAVPVRLTGDPGQLSRLIRNLGDNAVRHATSRVSVSLDEEDAAAVIDVSDDGAGVPEGHTEAVFARFVRLDEGRARDHGGSGLGLAIARDLARVHGGTVSLLGPGPGATFEVRLPLGACERGHPRSREDHRERSGRRERTGRRAGRSPGRAPPESPARRAG